MSETTPDALFGVDVDRAKDALEWLWDHRDEIARVAETLPSLLDSAGNSITAAGGGAHTAADLLIGTPERPGAKGLAEVAAKTLRSCEKELAELHELLDDLADRLDAINLPGVGTVFDQAAGKLRDGSARVDRVADGMHGVASTLTQLGGSLGEAAGGLRNAGDHLTDTGTTLRSLLADTPTAARTTTTRARPRSCPDRRGSQSAGDWSGAGPTAPVGVDATAWFKRAISSVSAAIRSVRPLLYSIRVRSDSVFE